MARRIKSKRGTMLTTCVLGILVFIDDYLNSLAVSASMKTLTDKYRISREKLAYLVDSTAAPGTIMDGFDTSRIKKVSPTVGLINFLLPMAVDAARLDLDPLCGTGGGDHLHPVPDPGLRPRLIPLAFNTCPQSASWDGDIFRLDQGVSGE
ncbi:hypothetical protein [Marinobacterium ramblicola]|uniref:hypothetical protein n=1 Tax=Marinobacterium ramblicola TaxID=2849041 RepID=UPI0031BB08BA